MKKMDDNPEKECGMKIIGHVTIGPKGQVVIPKEARETLGLKPGDDLLVLMKGEMAIGMVKSSDMKKVIEYMQEFMAK
ncbi:MAG TPA: AbrB/MazE/SpoVT family DNA-binding domain-containing protein [Candidatus Absconditabacterales bacterium]|nr:AbrB/MazE/SpoVT family DNA-binding domain-containing protein [Candidatus Absconditabacterales bacterium]HMT27134.1 AbrB/MazE/SpoVT family DNA-binding domain-containing protein [Candidatus Absconditabacterales bacterium]